MKNIWIICAMEDEAKIIIKKYNLKKIDDNFFEIFLWEVFWKKIFLLISKIWKIYSSAWTTYLLQKFNIDKIINIWLAWWLTKEKEIWKTFQITKVLQHDAYTPWDWEHLNYFQWEIKIPEIKWISTWICLTWDQFVDEKEKSLELAKKWDIVEMEAFSVASVAKIFNKPILILKSISDNACLWAKEDIYENLKKSMKDWVNTLNKVLEENLI